MTPWIDFIDSMTPLLDSLTPVIDPMTPVIDSFFDLPHTYGWVIVLSITTLNDSINRLTNSSNRPNDSINRLNHSINRLNDSMHRLLYWLASHIRMIRSVRVRNVTNMNKLRPHMWVVTRTNKWMNHDTHSPRTEKTGLQNNYDCQNFVRMSNGTNIHESRPHIWVVTHKIKWMNHDTHSPRTEEIGQIIITTAKISYGWVMSQIDMSHVHISRSWLIKMNEWITILTHHGRRRSDLLRPNNNYDCQNFHQVFTGVPRHVKHDFPGVSKFAYKFSHM